MILILIFFSIFAQANQVNSFLDDVDQFTRSDKILKVESEKTKSAGMLALSKKMLWTPSIGASFSKTQTRFNNDPTDDGKFFKIDGNWNLFRGGSDYYSMLSSSAAQESQIYQELSHKSQVEIKAAEVIFRKILLLSTIQANTEQKKQKEAALSIAKERYRSGRISQQELQKIEIDLSQQLNRIRQIEIEKIDLEQKLKTSFVQNIKTEIWPFADVKPSLFYFGEKSHESQKVYWAAQAKKHNWRAANLKHIPSLDFTFGYQRTGFTEDKSVFGGYYGNDKSWSTGFTLSIPIWSQMQTATEASLEHSSYQESLANFDNLEVEELAKREALKKKIQILHDSVSESKKVLEKTEELLKATMKGFQYGKVSTNDLFLEQNRLIETRLDYSQNQLAYHMAIVETCGMGGKSLRECVATSVK